jgi:hypothetical protein
MICMKRRVTFQKVMQVIFTWLFNHVAACRDARDRLFQNF